MKILNFGSLNIDYVYRVSHMVRRGETLSSVGVETFPGGKGLNQSIAMGKAGAQVFHAGAVGSEGRFLLGFLEEAHVNTELIRVLDGVPTGHAIIQNDAEGDNAIVLYGGANQHITRDQITATLSHFTADDRLVLQNEINELAFLIEQAHNRGMHIVLNPSPMDDKIAELPLSYVDTFILNELEAEQIGIGALRAQYPEKTVLITYGEKGSELYRGAEVIRQRSYPVHTMDTTAAGDTFTGYFIACEVSEMPLERAMDVAARAAAITVTRQGAGVSIPWADEVNGF